MFTKKVAKYYTLGLVILLVGVALSLGAWYAYAQAVSAEKSEVLRAETFKIGAGEFQWDTQFQTKN